MRYVIHTATVAELERVEILDEGDVGSRPEAARRRMTDAAVEEVEIDPKLAGELALNVAIGTRGQVVVLQIAEHSESLSWPFIDCLTRRMRSWHIYRRGESVVVAHLSLRLQPKKP